MRLGTFLLITSAAAGAFTAARRLMADAAVVDSLPEAAQAPATMLRAKLLAVRERVAEGFLEGRAERTAAEQELMREYHSRAHR